MVAYVCVPSWGSWAVQFAWGLWIYNVVVSVAVHFTIPFIMYEYLNPSPEDAIILTASQYVKHQDRVAFYYDRPVPLSIRYHGRHFRIRSHRCGHPAECAARPLDHHRQLYPLGHQHALRHDHHGRLLPASCGPQTSSSRSNRQCFPSCGATGTRWIYVCSYSPLPSFHFLAHH